MPVTAEFWFPLRDDDEVAFSDFDHPIASRAHIALAGCIGLDDGDGLYPEKTAHSTSTAATRMVPTTMAMSTAFVRWDRNGLNPMRRL